MYVELYMIPPNSDTPANSTLKWRTKYKTPPGVRNYRREPRKIAGERQTDTRGTSSK